MSGCFFPILALQQQKKSKQCLLFYVLRGPKGERRCAGLAQIQPPLTFEGQEPDLNSDS